MKIPYCYLTNDELEVNIKDIFEYIKLLHTTSDLSIASMLTYEDEWNLDKEGIIQAIYGERIDPKYNIPFYSLIEKELLPYLKRADGKSSQNMVEGQEMV